MQCNINWDNLKFVFTQTDFMYQAYYTEKTGWQEGSIVPFASIEISPAATVLNYGQGIFEGLKAQRNQRDEILLFRPEENAKRMQHSAKRLCIPPIPVEQFVTAIKAVVKHNLNFVPPFNKGSLYIRPCIWGIDPVLGVSPARKFLFNIFCSPVGNYFGIDSEGIKLKICHDFNRAAPKGTGDLKFIGNYTGGMLHKNIAHEQGFNECLYTDANEGNIIEEAGTANIFCVINNQLITPELGVILPGITRKSIISLARDILKLTVIEKALTIEELFTASESFLCGTATTITPIGMIANYDATVIFNDKKIGPITKELLQLLHQVQTGETLREKNWVVAV